MAAVAAFAVAAAYTALLDYPLPRIHDEFSYLLAGETLASGRVALPPASSPDHFETIHELQRPSYVSKYPPAQGLALAAGIVLGDSPRLGVWLSFAVLGGALVWMLQAWAPPGWSLLAALWTILLLGSTPWTYSYWGGAVPALGGALVFGALGRLSRARIRDACAMAVGVLILANSRPFEGLLVSIPAALYVLWWLVTNRTHSLARRLTRVILPASVLLCVGAAGMLAYNEAGTGHPLRTPYAEYEAQKGGAPVFVWGRVTPLQDNARATDRERWNGDVVRYERLQSVAGYRAEMGKRLKSTLRVYIPITLCFPLLLLPFILRGARERAAAAGLALVVLGGAVVAWHETHYFAPAVGVLLILYVRSLRTIDVVISRRRRWASVAIGGLVALLFLAGGLRFVDLPRGAKGWASPDHWTRQRAQVESGLRERGGRHIVFVRYLPSYKSAVEWVYNGADREGAPVLWANDLGDAANANLREWTPDRQGWLLELGDGPLRRTPLPYGRDIARHGGAEAGLEVAARPDSAAAVRPFARP